jgi:hypothetical protein
MGEQVIVSMEGSTMRHKEDQNSRECQQEGSELELSGGIGGQLERRKRVILSHL